ncbi:MAG: DUF3800 domain-containing protein [Chthonomonadaceae bacterium]|nr:DUF3800 domain-containing protein [Chthonomonadaceae bacterium]
MLVFVDEYGDTGQKIGQGSSEMMAIILVIFRGTVEAQRADHRIMQLRAELNKPAGFEFHFKDNSNVIREAFFRAIAPLEFEYTGVIVDKTQLQTGSYSSKTLYRDVCLELLDHASSLLQNASVKIDRSGSLKFRQELASFLKKQVNEANQLVPRIRDISTPASKNDSLLQMADMICGAVTRSVRVERQNDFTYRKIIAHREFPVRLWSE